MKRLTIFALFIVITILTALPTAFTHAQGDSDETPIILDDTSPAIDVMINLPPDATGVVAMETRNVTIQLLNANGDVIFESSDSRLQALELRIAPNTGQHQLVIERNAGAATGMVRLHSQFELRTYVDSMSELVLVSTGNTIEKGQELDSDLNIDQVSNTVSIQAAGDTPISVSSSFLGANITWQLVDNLNQVVATLFGGSIDGISMVLDAGQYEVSMLNNNPQVRTVANLRVEDVPNETMLMLLPETDNTSNVSNSNATSSTETVAVTNCTTTINALSINLRSGPGTGYSVLEYAFRNDSYSVGGMTPNGEWLLVGLDNTSSAWMLRSLGAESGVCNDLTVFDIPLLDAPNPQVTIVTTTSSVPSITDSSSTSIYDDDDNDHHEDDDEDHDDDHDDDDHHEEDDD